MQHLIISFFLDDDENRTSLAGWAKIFTQYYSFIIEHSRFIHFARKFLSQSLISVKWLTPR